MIVAAERAFVFPFADKRAPRWWRGSVLRDARGV